MSSYHHNVPTCVPIAAQLHICKLRICDLSLIIDRQLFPIETCRKHRFCSGPVLQAPSKSLAWRYQDNDNHSSACRCYPDADVERSCLGVGNARDSAEGVDIPDSQPPGISTSLQGASNETVFNCSVAKGELGVGEDNSDSRSVEGSLLQESTTLSSGYGTSTDICTTRNQVSCNNMQVWLQRHQNSLSNSSGDDIICQHTSACHANRKDVTRVMQHKLAPPEQVRELIPGATL